MSDAVTTVLKVFAESRLFAEGVRIIGSWCFHLYCRHLGAPAFPFRTLDIDFLIPYPYKGKDRNEFVQRLEEAGFHHDFRSDGSIFFWSTDLKIEFLVADRGRGLKNPVSIPQLAVNAVPLRYLTMLTTRSITVVDDGLPIRLPHPTDFCLHKILIAAKRTTDDKMEKDLRQALSVFSILDVSDLQWSPMFPLLQDDMDRLRDTLQMRNNDTL